MSETDKGLPEPSEARLIGEYLADHPDERALLLALAQIDRAIKDGRFGSAALMCEASEAAHLTTSEAQSNMRDWLAASRLDRCERCGGAVVELPGLHRIDWPIRLEHLCPLVDMGPGVLAVRPASPSRAPRRGKVLPL